MLPPVRDQHRGGIDLESRIPHRLGGDRILQLGEASDRGVLVVLRIATRHDRGFDDVVGGREVGLTGAEPDDGLTRGP